MTAEPALRRATARPQTGADYLASLDDGRAVYIEGERVRDVAAHPAFRNSARSIARLYDALHAGDAREVLTVATDTGNGGTTHRFFRVARSAAELVAQKEAIAAWSRMTYGFMGRTPDYKASLMATLGANAAFYGPFADNARAWHIRAQNEVLFLNHAIVNPPIDRSKPAGEVRDVYVRVEKETDAGIVVSGAKVVATSAALTQFNFLGQTAQLGDGDEDLAVMFILPMAAQGVKLVCRASYEQAAARNGTPFDYPLSSRFDENDAIFILDRVLVPWENVLVHRDLKRVRAFYPRSGFVPNFSFQGCVRFAVKLDFLAGLTAKALAATGGDGFYGNQVQLGEIIAWRNLFWSLADAMASAPDPWVEGTVLPNARAAGAYRVFASEAYPQVKSIVEKIIASGLIYLPSHARDLDNPEIAEDLARYVRGSGGMGHRERIKILKLLWDALGSEFGSRHELYERNYAGSHETIRAQMLTAARGTGELDAMTALVEECLADYDERGWTRGPWGEDGEGGACA